MKIPILLAAVLLAAATANGAEKLKALIVDGQNNHQVWPKGTIMMRRYLEETGLFSQVDVARTKFTWNGKREAAYLPLAGAGETEDLPQPKADPDFKPDFDKYDVVISNFGFNAAPWPEETRKAFEKYVGGGGGFVSVHAADNSFGDWPEYNRMIGLGGWGGRNPKTGPYVYIGKDGEVVREQVPGGCGEHGPRNSFLVTTRDSAHPITQGLPATWMHAEDECYSHLRGPAEEMTILATAAEPKKLREQGRNEPMMMAIGYKQGRVFHTTLGHDTEALECAGFIVTFQRGTEWAATGKVTQTEIAADFPSADKVSRRTFVMEKK